MESAHKSHHNSEAAEPFNARDFLDDFRQTMIETGQVINGPVKTTHKEELSVLLPDAEIVFRVGPAVLETLTPESTYQPIVGSGLSLEVPDVRELWMQLKDQAPVIFDLRDNDWGDTSFCIADPEGFEVTFFTKK